MEPLTVLAAVAASTSQLRLTTGVLVSPLRPPVLLAKIAATIDQISDGRLELGVGVGWQPEEFDAVGVDFAARGQLLTDGIGACRALWGDDPAPFSSPTTNFTELWCNPKPCEPGRDSRALLGITPSTQPDSHRGAGSWLDHAPWSADRRHRRVRRAAPQPVRRSTVVTLHRCSSGPDSQWCGPRSAVNLTSKHHSTLGRRVQRRGRHRSDGVVEQLHRRRR